MSSLCTFYLYNIFQVIKCNCCVKCKCADARTLCASMTLLMSGLPSFARRYTRFNHKFWSHRCTCHSKAAWPKPARSVTQKLDLRKYSLRDVKSDLDKIFRMPSFLCSMGPCKK